MNKICLKCKHYNKETETRPAHCSRQGERSDEYGSFRTGSNCIFDKNLENLFKAKEPQEGIKQLEEELEINLRKVSNIVSNSEKIAEKIRNLKQTK